MVLRRGFPSFAFFGCGRDLYRYSLVVEVGPRSREAVQAAVCVVEIDDILPCDSIDGRILRLPGDLLAWLDARLPLKVDSV